MEDNLILKILLAGVFLMVLVRMYPTAKHWLENGPRGDKNDWISAIVPLVAVIVFVMFLISYVRG